MQIAAGKEWECIFVRSMLATEKGRNRRLCVLCSSFLTFDIKGHIVGGLRHQNYIIQEALGQLRLP